MKRASTHPARRIRAITIDLDDTLWPIGPTIARAERRAYEWLLARAPTVALAWPIERQRAWRMSLLAARVELRHDLLAVRRLSLEAAFHECGAGLAQSATLIADALDVFMAARNEIELYPEVAACLERLSQRYPLASLTNGNADLARIGLGYLFRATVSAHEHGTCKPDPALFHIACSALDCAPDEVVHLGDDIELDVRGARSAGLHAVWVNRNDVVWPGEDAPVTVPHLAAFEQWLARA